MRILQKLSINEADLSAQSLSRERMKAIKGGGGNCYFYCGGYNSTSMTIVSDCNSNPCSEYEIPYCTCY